MLTFIIPYLLILALIAIDYVTGIIGACMSGTFDSTTMRHGLVHKSMYFIAIAVGMIVEQLMNWYGLPYSQGVLTLVCVWVIVTELGSIMENLVVINPSFKDNAFMRIFATREDEVEAEERSRADA